MSNAGYIRSGLLQRGLPGHVADAFIVNFRDESGLNPGINEAKPLVPGSRGGFGLYQLTGPRRREYEAFASRRGVQPSDVDAQLDFLMGELQGSERRAGQRILSAPDTATAAQAIVNDFLRPAASHRAKRSARYASLGGGASAYNAEPQPSGAASAIDSILGTGSAPKGPMAYGGDTVAQGGRIGGLGGLGGFTPPSQDVGLDTGAILRALGAGLIAGDASAVPAYLQQAIADQQRNVDRDYEREWQQYVFRTGLEENDLVRQQQRADRYEDRDWSLQDQVTERQNGLADYRTKAEIDAEFEAKDPTRGPRTSLSPIYGTDANGDAVLLQPRDDGTIVQTQLPEGVSLSTGVDRIDAGNQWILVDKRSGATVGTVPKDNYTPAFDSAAGTEAGRTTAERTASLGQSQGTAERALAQLDLLENHPGLSSAVGWQGNIPEWMIPAGTDTANFLSVLGQVQGQSFLQAFESLKGGGAITEIEGQKATQAITRLSRNLSEAEFKAAIGELRGVINAGLERARNGTVVNVPSAGAPSATPAAAPAPATTPSQPRSLDDLLSTYGGS